MWNILLVNFVSGNVLRAALLFVLWCVCKWKEVVNNKCFIAFAI